MNSTDYQTNNITALTVTDQLPSEVNADGGAPSEVNGRNDLECFANEFINKESYNEQV